MNIELIKSELEKLSLMLSEWEGDAEVSSIERDIALDKLKNIYDLVRFDSKVVAATPVAAPAVEEEPAEEEEKDVEVELIFAEEDELFTTLPDLTAEEDAPTTEPSLASEIFASAMAVSPLAESIITEEEPATAPEPEPAPIAEPEPEPAPVVEEPAPIVEAEPIAEAVTEPEVEVEVATEPEPVAEVEAEPEPVIEVEPEPVAEVTTEPEVEKTTKREEPRSLNSLFGLEEVQRRPRTKHQRMMSIYSDSEPRPEKVVDISKIFDMDVDAPKPMTSKAPERKAAPQPAPAAVEEERTVTIADAMAASTQTLADTLITPVALGDDINHSKINSLRDGIGLNDKFLMIRDLFDGDDEAYDEALTALDSMETLDDCMIHIIENYAWNPDTEGSKFIMQLLERKLS
ncbi:MAG: hypothetical protein II236_09025 [Alistipes sp.]|nr:hypothetical protein [Alistipes sp.]